MNLTVRQKIISWYLSEIIEDKDLIGNVPEDNLGIIFDCIVEDLTVIFTQYEEEEEFSSGTKGN